VAIAKQSGQTTVLVEGDELMYGIWEMQQDADSLYLLRAGREVFRVGKPNPPVSQ
jgi:hypothetical protein